MNSRPEANATPAACFVATRLGAEEAVAEQRGQQWRYEGADLRIASNCPRVSVFALEDLAAVPNAADILVARPLLNPAEWVDALTAREEFFLTIDHFVHLEALNGITWPRPPKVLIEIAVGPARFGGRPGRDAVDLAKAVSAAKSVEFAGLSAEVRSMGMADSLLQTREQILDAGLSCDRVSVLCPPEICGELPAGMEVRNDAAAFAGTIARVISRPSLELAVIDLGSQSGLAVKQDICLTHVGKQIDAVAKVRQVDPGRTLLVLPEEAHDVFIGDQVVLPEITGRWSAEPVELREQ